MINNSQKLLDGNKFQNVFYFPAEFFDIFSLAPFVHCPLFWNSYSTLLSVQAYCYSPVLTLATQHQSVSFEIVNKEQITISASLLLHLGQWPSWQIYAKKLLTSTQWRHSKAINLPGKIPSFFKNWDHGGLEKVQRSKGDIFPVFQDIFHWHGGAQFLRNSQRRKKSRRDSLNGAGIGGFYKSLHSPRLEEQLEGATRIWEVKVAPKIQEYKIQMKNVLHFYWT